MQENVAAPRSATTAAAGTTPRGLLARALAVDACDAAPDTSTTVAHASQEIAVARSDSAVAPANVEIDVCAASGETAVGAASSETGVVTPVGETTLIAANDETALAAANGGAAVAPAKDETAVAAARQIAGAEGTTAVEFVTSGKIRGVVGGCSRSSSSSRRMGKCIVVYTPRSTTSNSRRSN